MKVIVVLSVLALVASAAVLKNGQPPVISSLHADELDEFTAATLEALGPLGDDGDDDTDKDAASFGEDGEDEGEENSTNDVIYANVTEDGMIEVEDTIVSPEMFDVMFPHVADHPENSGIQTVHKRAAGVKYSNWLWPGGRIPYTYSSNLVGSQRKVRAAMDEWEKSTCIKFEYRKSTDKNYVKIKTKTDSAGRAINACWSWIGYAKRVQYLYLGSGCFSHKTILHELGHTIGLIHEHQHPQRDRYVTIHWNNIEPSKVKENFNPRTDATDHGLGYDPLSIMHYRSNAFSKKGCKSPCNTVESKQGSSITRSFGSANKLSAKSDIPIVKKMYCSKKG